MFEINGKYTKALVLAETIEEECISQIQNICNCEVFEDCKIVIMEDTHAGKGSVIGFTCTMPKNGRIIPNIIGVDIACAMLCIKLKDKEIDYQLLDDTIRKYVPSGYGQRNEISKLVNKDIEEKVKDICKVINLDAVEQLKKCGSLGGGNHFISIEEGQTGKYLIIHSGSRNIGLQVASYFQKKAISK